MQLSGGKRLKPCLGSKNKAEHSIVFFHTKLYKSQLSSSQERESNIHWAKQLKTRSWVQLPKCWAGCALWQPTNPVVSALVTHHDLSGQIKIVWHPCLGLINPTGKGRLFCMRKQQAWWISWRQASGCVSSKGFQISLQAFPNTLLGKVHFGRSNRQCYGR